MSIEFKNFRKYLISILVLAVSVFLINYIYSVIKNKTEMSNILAIAGISGAKAYTLEPSMVMRIEIQEAKSNPSAIINKLEDALNNKMLEYGKIRNQYGDQNSPAAKTAFEASYAYAVRIILLKKWKPGMSKEEIVQNYIAQTNHLKTTYDFKNHADDFLGFK